MIVVREIDRCNFGIRETSIYRNILFTALLEDIAGITQVHENMRSRQEPNKLVSKDEQIQMRLI
jgi:hypothetical protein